jgi:predicted DNA-binding transcriptional regulator AlpA
VAKTQKRVKRPKSRTRGGGAVQRGKASVKATGHAKRKWTREAERAPHPPTPDALAYRPGQLVRILGVSRATLGRWRDDPAMHFPKPYRFSGVLLWKRSDVEAWVAWWQQGGGDAYIANTPLEAPSQATA